MKLVVNFSDITDLVNNDRLTADYEEAVSDLCNAIFNDLTAPPPVGTPVDTGNARNGWQIDLSDPLHGEIYNTVPYIGRLNAGHSKQSPSGFVEAILDKHLR